MPSATQEKPFIGFGIDDLTQRKDIFGEATKAAEGLDPLSIFGFEMGATGAGMYPIQQGRPMITFVRKAAGQQPPRPGERGPPGSPGPAGAHGYNGRDGIDGHDGMDGAPGQQGPEGVRGEKGDNGDKGDAGYTPIKGIDYFDGERGEKGDKGDAGKNGKNAKCASAKDFLGFYKIIQEERDFFAYLFAQELIDRQDERSNAGIRLMHERGTYFSGKEAEFESYLRELHDAELPYQMVLNNELGKLRADSRFTEIGMDYTSAYTASRATGKTESVAAKEAVAYVNRKFKLGLNLS